MGVKLVPLDDPLSVFVCMCISYAYDRKYFYL